MNTRRIFACVASLGLALVANGSGGCGGNNDSGAPGGGNSASSLDCGWLASDNCWKTTAAAAMGCLPASTAMGKLSADLKTCTYTTGEVVSFDTPLTLPLPQQPVFNFTVTSGGAQCFGFHQPSMQGFSMTTSAGTVTAGEGAVGYSVSCPDGTAFASSNPLGLLSCDAGVFGGLPGDFDSSTNTSATMSVLGVGAMALPIFNCQM